MSNVQVVKGIYEALGKGDIPGLLGNFDAQAEWRLAEGHPYDPEGKPLVGPEAILKEFFMRAGADWDGFAISPSAFRDAGETVVVECRYSGTHNGTDKSLDAQACHVWELRDGKITSFQQYIDTAQLQEVMGAQ